jgi:ferric-dicitrate binding protein FerR (iron transport regulator)
MLRTKAALAWAEFLFCQGNQDVDEEAMREAFEDWTHARHDHLAALAALGRRGVS